MKLLVIILLPIYSFCQVDTAAPKTKLERNAIKVGTIIKKNFIDVYEFDGLHLKFAEQLDLGGNLNLQCKALTIKDVASGIVTKGLYLSSYSSDIKSSYTGYIDADEINGLIKFLDFLIANKDNEEPEGTEYIYTCSDVQFASFNTKDKDKIIWNYLVRVDKWHRSYSQVNFRIKNIEELLQALKTNKAKFE
jgi:hypothetical protein